MTEPHDRDDVERAVRCSVAASVEPVTVALLAAARRLRGDSAELRKCSFVADAVGVVSDGDEELAGKFGADTEDVEELRGDVGDEAVDLIAELFDLCVERLPATREIPQ